MKEITEDTRVVANTKLDYINHLVLRGDEGTVIGFTGRDGDDLLIEWDRGFQGSAGTDEVDVINNEKETS